jgi:hypothetical protein
VYPQLDSVVASVQGAPAVSRILGFDGDVGVLAFIHDKGQPRRLDRRAAEWLTVAPPLAAPRHHCTALHLRFSFIGI